MRAIEGVAVFVGSIIAAYGIYVPSDLVIFKLLAVVAALCGYQIGYLTERKVKSLSGRRAWLVAAVIVAVISAMGYSTMIQMGSANVWHIWVLGALLVLLFLSFTFVLPFVKESIRALVDK